MYKEKGSKPSSAMHNFKDPKILTKDDKPPIGPGGNKGKRPMFTAKQAKAPRPFTGVNISGVKMTR